MARGDFLASSDRKFSQKLAVKELKTWPTKVPLNQLLALRTSFIMNLARLPKRLATPELDYNTIGRGVHGDAIGPSRQIVKKLVNKNYIKPKLV
jgi:hypothetical protein